MGQVCVGRCMLLSIKQGSPLEDELVVEGGKGGQECEPVEEGQVAAGDEDELEEDLNDGAYSPAPGDRVLGLILCAKSTPVTKNTGQRPNYSP